MSDYISPLDSSSILDSIKSDLGISHHDYGFDREIKDLINGEFMALQQLGVGPKAGFSINSSDEIWGDFVEDRLMQDSCRTYVYLRVKLLFDPPASSVVADAMKERIAELEFRLNCHAEGSTSA